VDIIITAAFILAAAAVIGKIRVFRLLVSSANASFFNFVRTASPAKAAKALGYFSCQRTQ
jgi:hypothetical protein